jgi:hypothetical protein
MATNYKRQKNKPSHKPKSVLSKPIIQIFLQVAGDVVSKANVKQVLL